jgi:hypothetical protein
VGLSELISSIVQPLFDLLPRITARPATNEYAVVDSWFFGVKEFTAPRIFLPVMTHIEYYPKAEHPIDTGLQSLTTSCGKSVCVNATAIVKVVDPILLRERVASDSWEHWVSMIIRKHVRACAISSDGWAEFVESGDQSVEWEVQEELLYAGVELSQIVLEDSTEAFPVRILQSESE